jgi:transcriptional regulator with XRE-family HTH domain
MKGNFFYKRLGDNIITGRRKRRISQEQLALTSDVDRTYVARLEQGKANPTIKTLNKLCKTLKIRLEKLLEGV